MLADRIKTFTEQIGDEEAVRAPRKWLSEASAILFLGFGFNDQNMKLIKPHNSRGSQKVYATAAGMFDPDVAVARAGIVEMLELRGATDSNVFPVRTDLTCARLLQEYGRIIQAGIPWRRER